MKKLIVFFLICLMAFSDGCDLVDKCKDTEKPEINFNLYVFGDVVVRSLETGEVATSDWCCRSIKALVTKYYCNGTAKGPFTTLYNANSEGILVVQSYGSWGYRMDNEKDYMRIVFFYEGSELGKYHAYYDMLAQYDGVDANLKFKIEIDWDFQNEKLYSSKVILQ